MIPRDTPLTAGQGRFRLGDAFLGTQGAGGISVTTDRATGHPALAAVSPLAAPQPAPATTAGLPVLTTLDPPFNPQWVLVGERPPGVQLHRIPFPVPDGVVRRLVLSLLDVLAPWHAAGNAAGFLQPQLIFVDPDADGGPRVTGIRADLMAFLHQQGATLSARGITRVYAAPEVERGGPPTVPGDLWSVCAIGAWMVAAQPSAYHELFQSGLAPDPAARITADRLREALHDPAWQRDPAWRRDPRLTHRLHHDHPDDVQVLVHEGGPRRSQVRPELVWVRITRAHGPRYEGVVLNQPTNVTSVSQGDAIEFVVPRGEIPPLMITPDYLTDRERWEVSRCDRCGSDELFDPPTALMRVTFPDLGDMEMEVFTATCPWCGGRQMVTRKGEAPSPVPTTPQGSREAGERHPRPGLRLGDRDQLPPGVSVGGGRYLVDEHLGGLPDCGLYRGRTADGRSTLISTSYPQRRPLPQLTEELAMPVEGMGTLLDIQPLDDVSYRGVPLVAMVEEIPAGMAPLRVGVAVADIAARVVGLVAQILVRLDAGGHPLPGIHPETVFVDRDYAGCALLGRTDLFHLGATDPSPGPRTFEPCWAHFWPSPELIRAQLLTVASAVWELSVVGLLLLIGGIESPVEGMVARLAAIHEHGLRDQVPEGRLPLTDLLRAGLDPDPAVRPSPTDFAAFAR